MNKTFKVVFSKARGTLMVVNELTSSVQAKGTKTVVAAAVAALMAGGAMAAETETAIPDIPEDAVAEAPSEGVFSNENYKFVPTTAGTVGFYGPSKSGVFDKNLWIDVNSKNVDGSGFWATGTDTEFVNEGNIYIDGTGANSWEQQALSADNGATAVNSGKIVARNAYGMSIGTAGSASTIINNHEIIVESQGVGMELGGADKSIAVNNGTITVGAPVEVDGASWTLGVLVKETTDNKFTNNGTIDAVKGTAAIKVENEDKTTDGAFVELTETSKIYGKVLVEKKESDKATSGPTGTKITNAGLIDASQTADKVAIEVGADADKTTITMLAGSKVNGALKLAGKNTMLNLKGANDTYSFTAESTGSLTVNITDGADVAFADEVKTEGGDVMTGGRTFNEVNITEGKLTASIWQDDNKFTKVNVGKGGVFNITKLNSGGTANDLENDPHDTLLIGFNAGLTLAGGELWQGGKVFEGNLKIGTKTKGEGGLDVENGSSLTLARLETGENGTIWINAEGAVTTNDLHISKGEVNVNEGGHLVVKNDLTFFDDADHTAKLAVNEGGTLTLDGKNVFTNTAGEDAEDAVWGASAGWTEHVEGEGIVEIMNEIEKPLTLEQLKTAQDLVNQANNANFQLVFTGATLDVTDNKASVSEVDSLIAEDVTATAESNTAEFKKKTTVAAIDFSAAETDTATIMGVGVLTLSGNNGDVFVFGEESKVEKVTAAAVKLGQDASSTGNVNVKTFQATDLTVAGNFVAEDVITTGNFTLEDGAKLDAKKVTLAQTTTISGYLKAETVTDYAAAAGVSLLDTGTNVSGTIETHTFGATGTFTEGGKLYVYGQNTTGEEPAWKAAQVTGTATIKMGALFTTNANVAHVADKAVAYIDDTVEVTGQVKLGDVSNAAATGLTVGKDGLLTVDASAFTEDKAAIEGTLKVDGGAVEFDKLGKVGSFKLADTVEGTVTATSNNIFIKASVAEKMVEEASAGWFVTTEANKTVSKDEGFNLVAAKVTNGYGNDSVRDVLAAIGDKTNTTAGFVENDQLTALGVAAAEEFLALPVTAGTYNVAYDAMSQVTRAVAKKNVSGEGMGVWADVFYASNEAETLYNGQQGYSADIYGGVLGFDTTFSCGAKLGVALTVGTGDADSEKSVSKFSNDADFWGLSLYTGKNVADTKLYVGLDLSYLWIDNDVKGTVAGVKADESLDSTAFSVGLTADWTAYEGAFSIVPHAGIRYTAIDVDDYRGLASESVNVLELPVGVKFTGSFETAGWTFVPALDFTVVPQIGDTEVDTVVGAVDVIDNTYNTTIGFEAKNGNIAFGLNAGYGFGNEDRKNATVNANVRYSF